MKLTNHNGNLSSAQSQTLVLLVGQDEKNFICGLGKTDCSWALDLLKDAHKNGRVTGAKKEAAFFRGAGPDGENLLSVGLGKKGTINEESLRIASAVACKALVKEKISDAVVALQSFRKLTKSADAAGRAVSEGFLLGAYKFDLLKAKSKSSYDGLKEVVFSVKDKTASKKFAQGVKAGEILAEATNFARDLGNRPGNHLTPVILADLAKQASKGTAIKFQALNKAQIQKLNMGCFLGVNKGSHEEPRLIIMEYFGGKKSDKPFVMVGKGLTFDTGGISIKPSGAMEEMKFDMCGSAAVIGAIVALAKMKAKVNVVTVVPSTENMPGGAALKPGDVLTSRNGKTVEVNNTDAEGRLILSDALSYACDKYKPKAMIDAATLTGACVISLGNLFSGVMTKDDKFMKKIEQASNISGEPVWRLPLTDDHVSDMKGTYADLSNVSSSRGAGTSTAGAFLSQFVDPKIPWAHFDIAGTAWHTGNRKAYNTDKGGTGVMVRLFCDLAMNY